MINRPETPQETLLRRVARLKTTSEALQGNWNRMVEAQLYLLLETKRSRPRAVLRYAWVAISDAWHDKIFAIQEWRRDRKARRFVHQWIQSEGSKKKENGKTKDSSC